MAGSLGSSESTDAALVQLIASDSIPLQKEITLKASVGDLVRGTVLEMVSALASTWQQLTAGSPANARAILAEDVDDSAATQKAQAYFPGKYYEKNLVWPAAITTANKRTALQTLQDRGIIIDEAWLDVSTTTTTTTTTSSSSTTTTTTST